MAMTPGALLQAVQAVLLWHVFVVTSVLTRRRKNVQSTVGREETE